LRGERESLLSGTVDEKLSVKNLLEQRDDALVEALFQGATNVEIDIVVVQQ